MTINKRKLATALAAGALALAAPGPLFAQGNNKMLKVLVGYAPGGAADVVARAVGDGLRTSGYQVIVENKPGAAGRLATESLLTMPADGATLLFAPTGNLTIYPHIYRSIKYDSLKDLVPVASATGMSFGIAVGNSIPAKTLQEYIALAKADSSKAAYGTPGAGTAMHFLGVMLGRQAKVPLTHVPYKGGSAALTDAIGGQLPAVITTLPNLVPMQKAGKLRILAISSAEPVAALPGVPTFKAAGYPELGVAELFGFFARAGTPPATVAQLNTAITAAVKSPAVVEALQKLEFEPRTMSSDDLGKFIKSEHARWGEIVKATGYTPEE